MAKRMSVEAYEQYVARRMQDRERTMHRRSERDSKREQLGAFA